MPERKLVSSKVWLTASLAGALLLLAATLAGCGIGSVGAGDGLGEADATLLPSTPAGESRPSTPSGDDAIPTPQPVNGLPAGSGSDDYEDDRYTEIEFRGVLSAVDGDVWTVNGQQVIVPDSVNLTIFQVGSFVKVEAWLNADGELIAKEIELEDDHSGGDDGYDDDDFDDDRDDDEDDD